MQNLRFCSLAVFLVGCSQSPVNVYVDLSEVPPSSNRTVLPKVDDRPRVSTSPVVDSRTIPGEEPNNIENLRADEKIAIRKEVEKETNDAIETISNRLIDYYAAEFDEFSKVEFAKLVPFKRAQMTAYLNSIRTLFEVSAKKRGPLLTKLSFLTGFPPIENQVPIEGENLSRTEIKRRVEINKLQDEIKAIDVAYESAIRNLDLVNSDDLVKEFKLLENQVNQKKLEIDQRASKEATNLVRNFSSSLSERIFSKYTFQLKEIPTKTVKFPKLSSSPTVPRVTFDRNQANQNTKEELNREIETFLSLNRYNRVAAPEGAKDVTKEFIEWRTNLKSGHWENLQKSSAQN